MGSNFPASCNIAVLYQNVSTRGQHLCTNYSAEKLSTAEHAL